MNHFKIKNKFVFGAFIFWFSFVSLVLPMRAVAVDGADQNVPGGSTVTTPTNPTPGYAINQYDTYNPLNIQLPTGTSNPSAAASNPGEAYGSNTPAGGVGDLAQESIAALGTCSIGTILGRLIGSLIGTLINQLMTYLGNVVFKKVVGAAADLVRCLEHPVLLCTIDSHAVDQLSFQNAKTTGYPDFSISGLIRFAMSGVSMDAIMYCIVNEILTYITQATVNWINSGFNGNPVFIQNPGALLQTIADQEMNSFIMSLNQSAGQSGAGGLGVQIGNGRISMYPPVADSVVRSLVAGYSNNNAAYFAAQRPQYLPQTPAGYQAWMRGQQYISQPSVMLMEAPFFSPWYQGAMMAGYAGQQVAAAQENQRMRNQYNNGFQTPVKCAPGQTREYDGTCVSNGILDTYSGHQLASNLQNRDLMPYLRVSLAKDFDSIITALVNQLIKIAVTDISKKTGISPTTIYSTGAAINNQILYNAANGTAVRADPANPGNGVSGFYTNNDGTKTYYKTDASGRTVTSPNPF